jgi:acyl carrier protein
MSRERHREKLLRFLETIRKPDRPLEGLAGDAGLVDSGLIDSLALVEIVVFLETEYAMDFEERGIDPAELASIESILDLIEAPPA